MLNGSSWPAKKKKKEKKENSRAHLHVSPVCLIRGAKETRISKEMDERQGLRAAVLHEPEDNYTVGRCVPPLWNRWQMVSLRFVPISRWKVGIAWTKKKISAYRGKLNSSRGPKWTCMSRRSCVFISRHFLCSRVSTKNYGKLIRVQRTKDTGWAKNHFLLE